VDFTLSNELPSDPKSLHYLNSDTQNPYQLCFAEVLSVLDPYVKSDRKGAFLYGFGGVPQGQREVSHCWPLSGLHEDGWTTEPEMCYQNAVLTTAFQGPTYFAPTLRRFREQVDRACDLTYSVMVILTDGSVHDLD
jgi:hypothetical protein